MRAGFFFTILQNSLYRSSLYRGLSVFYHILCPIKDMQIQLKLAAAQCEGQGFQSNIKAFLKITTAFLWVQM